MHEHYSDTVQSLLWFNLDMTAATAIEVGLIDMTDNRLTGGL